jgi:hypothetical protein
MVAGADLAIICRELVIPARRRLKLLFNFTVSSTLSLMNPAVVAVIVALPTARPVANPRSVIVAFEECEPQRAASVTERPGRSSANLANAS